MQFIKNLKLIWKVMIPILIGFAAILIVLFGFALPDIEKSLFAEKENFVKNIVESSVSMIETYERQFAEQKISKEEALAKIEELILNTRFEGDNYLFVTDFDKMLYHGVNQKLHGRELGTFKDVNEKQFLKEGADILKNEVGTFIDYYWSKPNVEGQFRKISYSQKTKGFNMIVTAGVYVDDIEKQVAAVKQEITIEFLIVIVGILIVMWLMVKFTIINPMNLITKISNQVAAGNLKIDEKYESNDEIGNVFDATNKMVENLRKLLSETQSLTQSAYEGKLDVRGRHNLFEGSYSELVQGINGTLDAIIAPLNVAAEYIDRISKGDMPPKIVDNYRGDFNEIKNNINQCIDSITYLVEDANDLAKNAVEGKLSARANEMRHNGDFRKVISGVNSTLDRLVGLIDNMPIPVQIVDKNYQITYINKAAKDLSMN